MVKYQPTGGKPGVLRYRRRFGTVLFCLAVAGGIGGCFLPSHLHSDQRAQNAQSARDAMDEYSKDSPAVYAAMRNNLQLFSADEDALLSELTAEYSTSLTAVYGLDLTGPALAIRIQSVDACFSAIDEVTSGEPVSQPLALVNDVCSAQDINQLQLGLADAMSGTKTSAPPDVGAQIQALNQQVSDLSDRVTKWNENIALLHEAISEYPTISADATKAGTPDWKAISGKIGDQKFTYVDVNGKQQSTDVKTALQGNEKLLQDTFASTGGSSNALLDVFKAPGLELQIMQLGLTLLQLEQQADSVALAQAQAVKETLDQARSELWVARALIAPGATSGVQFCPNGSKNYTILDGLIYIRKFGKLPSNCFRENKPVPVDKSKTAARKNTSPPPDKLKTIAEIMFNLRLHATSEIIVRRTLTILPLKLERLAHSRSIDASELNARAYQAIVSSGIDGLVAYENGGLTAAEIGDIIQFAQAIGVGVIAGRVN
jgi:hypothetical protein